MQNIIPGPHLLIQKGLLGLQGRTKALHPLAFFRERLLGITLLLPGFVELVLNGCNPFGRLFALQLQGFLLFQQVFELGAVHLTFQQLLFVLKLALAGQQLLNGILKRADSGLGQLCLAPRVR